MSRGSAHLGALRQPRTATTCRMEIVSEMALHLAAPGSRRSRAPSTGTRAPSRASQAEATAATRRETGKRRASEAGQTRSAADQNEVLREVRSADIFCPRPDLSARAGIHYGRRQIILREWIDPCLFHHVQCKSSDTWSTPSRPTDSQLGGSRLGARPHGAGTKASGFGAQRARWFEGSSLRRSVRGWA